MFFLLNKMTIARWAMVGLFNLLCVAALGLLMRLKFVIPIVWIEQKNIMHAHSHFAFSGWVSHILIVLIVMIMCEKSRQEVLPLRYQLVVLSNIILAFSMLISFTLQGYGIISIVFSTLTLFVSFIFACFCWRDLRYSKLDPVTICWFRAALLFLVCSSFGTFLQAYFKATGIYDIRKQLAAVYFYLHFQYNGWFFFTCMGLLTHWLRQVGLQFKFEMVYFRVFVVCALPTYVLSVLWWGIPNWLHLLLAIVVILQLLSWSKYIFNIAKEIQKNDNRKAVVKWLQGVVLTAVFIKLLLQALSVIPSLSIWVYSFRPIVIAYLHLVLLLIITLFILSYLYHIKVFVVRKNTVRWTAVIVIGIIGNEVLLALQGVCSLIGLYLSYIPIGLVAVSASMVCGLVGVFITVSARYAHHDDL